MRIRELEPPPEDFINYMIELSKFQCVLIELGFDIARVIDKRETKEDMLYPIHKSYYYRRKLRDLVNFTFKT